MPGDTEGHTQGHQYLTFSLNGEIYAMESSYTQEVIELKNITKIPHLPEFFKGVINLRGNIIPVIDLKIKFGMGSGAYKRHTCVIITEFSVGVIGLIVDAVLDVLCIPDGSIKTTPSFGTKVRLDFIKGMGKAGEQMVIILDIDKVLTDEDTSVGETMVEGQGSGAASRCHLPPH